MTAPRVARSRFGSSLLTLMFTAGCGEGTIPTTAVTPGSPQFASIAVAGIDSAWNTFSADVTVSMTGGGVASQPGDPRVEFSYRTTKSLGADGRWTTETTYDRIAVPGTNRAFSIHKMVRRADGSTELFGSRGEPLDLTGVQSVPPELRDKVPKRVASNPAMARSSDPRAWINNFVWTPESRAKHLINLKRSFELSALLSDGATRYRLQKAARVFQIVLDSVGRPANES